ncbi:MAG: hypothetical protein MJ176_10970 [Treponema sp.]|nr:hypothetical protein [Treponema sp.]
MKKLLSIILYSVFAFSALSAETLFMKVGSKNFELEVNESGCAKEFLKFVNGKNLKMTKYGGFEFYIYEKLKTSGEPAGTKYSKGNIYYNTVYNAISFAYEDHDLGDAQAVLIGTFKDKEVCDFLKSADNNTSFTFSK